jgi:predicted house-cleaning NTP pyrophosphatase (Maf/HAM1 superfamily)
MQIALPTQRTIVKYVLIFGISKSCCIWIQADQLYCCAERRLKKPESEQVHSYDYVKFHSRWPGVWAAVHLVILKSRSVGQCE